jgi:hypothetical protein
MIRQCTFGMAIVLAALVLRLTPAGAQENSAESNSVEQALAPGFAAMEQFDFEQALAVFGDAAQQAPFDPRVLYAIGSAHVALKHNALAALYYTAYLDSWDKAPNKESQADEIDRLRRPIFTTSRQWLRLAADLALSLPEEDRSKLHLGEQTAKQRAVLQVLYDLIMTHDAEAAEKLATAYPLGATMTLARAAGDYAALDMENDYSSKVLEMAARIAPPEAASPYVQFFESFDGELALSCTNPDLDPCPADTNYYKNPEAGDNKLATEALLKLTLARWASWDKRPALAYQWYNEAIALARQTTDFVSGVVSVDVPGGQGNVYFSPANVDADRVALSLPEGAKYRPETPDPNSQDLVFGGTPCPRTDSLAAIVHRSLATGFDGESVSFDDLMLGDSKAFIRSIKPDANRSAFDAVIALADAGRRHIMLADRIYPKFRSICP